MDEQPYPDVISPRLQVAGSKMNINAKEFKPTYKKKPKMLFKVTYHPENMDGNGAKCISEPMSAQQTNETASTCIDAMSSNMSNLLLTVRNSTKSSPFDLDSEDTFMMHE